MCYFFIEVECAGRDLHSGSFGGCVWVFCDYICKNGILKQCTQNVY